MKLEFNETVVLYARKHWVFFALQITPIVLLALLPIIFPFLLDLFLPKTLERFQSASWALYFMWLTILWLWSFLLWTEYYLDVLVITTKRIIHADQKSLFSRNMSTLELEKIQDVTVEVDGFLETILGFGTVRIQTAGEMKDFVLYDAYRPETVKEEILSAQSNIKEEILRRQSGFIRDGLGY